MKQINCLLVLLLLVTACKNEKPAKEPDKKIVLKDYRALVDEIDRADMDSLVLMPDCSGEYDSTVDAYYQALEDSIVEIYEQLELRMQLAAKQGRLKGDINDLSAQFKASREAFFQSLDADAEIYNYSFNGATAAGEYASCYTLKLLQDRLLLLKGLFSKFYWNYDMDSLETIDSH